jgi:murein DD-endopeptidase MepM/ murein hydrolase activator NlpD
MARAARTSRRSARILQPAFARRSPTDESLRGVRRRMREHRSVSLLCALAVLLTVSVVVSLPAGALVSPSATATPSPSPSPSEPPSPTDSSTPSVSPSGSPSSDPTSSTSPTLTPRPSPSTAPTPHGGGGAVVFGPRPGRSDRRLLRAESRRHRHRSWKGWAPDPRWGTYGTAALDRAARRARRRGWTERRVARRIYAPFIVEGPATWSDSWGAPRFAGGYHPHHGQDVLCAYGAPVLAVEGGTVEYGTDPLGGRYAFLVRDDGSYWYYAHLRSYARHVSSGEHVTTGRIIGRCGATGDASVPHVHFALFSADGLAIDPMSALVSWLRTAEHGLPSARKPTRSPPQPVVLPLFHVASRAGSAGPPTPPPPAAAAAHTALGTPAQRALSAAAFMMLFASALWGSPSRRRGRVAPRSRWPTSRKETV